MSDTADRCIGFATAEVFLRFEPALCALALGGYAFALRDARWLEFFGAAVMTTKGLTGSAGAAGERSCLPHHGRRRDLCEVFAIPKLTGAVLSLRELQAQRQEGYREVVDRARQKRASRVRRS